MITPPTDRLHKFAALSGIALVLFAIALSIEKYDEAQNQKIEAIAALERLTYAEQDFARVVNESIEIDKQAKAAGLPGWQAPGYRERFEKLRPEVERLRKRMHDSFADGDKPILRAVQLERMRNFWFTLAGASVALGVVLAYYGFRAWLHQPPGER